MVLLFAIVLAGQRRCLILQHLIQPYKASVAQDHYPYFVSVFKTSPSSQGPCFLLGVVLHQQEAGTMDVKMSRSCCVLQEIYCTVYSDQTTSVYPSNRVKRFSVVCFSIRSITVVEPELIGLNVQCTYHSRL
jgi:hypothetical protein